MPRVGSMRGVRQVIRLRGRDEANLRHDLERLPRLHERPGMRGAQCGNARVLAFRPVRRVRRKQRLQDHHEAGLRHDLEQMPGLPGRCRVPIRPRSLSREYRRPLRDARGDDLRREQRFVQRCRRGVGYNSGDEHKAAVFHAACFDVPVEYPRSRANPRDCFGGDEWIHVESHSEGDLRGSAIGSRGGKRESSLRSSEWNGLHSRNRLLIIGFDGDSRDGWYAPPRYRDGR